MDNVEKRKKKKEKDNKLQKVSRCDEAVYDYKYPADAVNFNSSNFTKNK